jgi:AcrR family transcriptional regulator
MDDTTPARLPAGPRRPNARGQGERLREEIISAAARLLGELADDEALSLRAVARAVSVSPTSVYLYFPDRDALVAAAMERCHAQMLQAADEAEAAHPDPALGLRARILAQAAWVQEHRGIYKVMHESKVGMPFKEAALTRTTAAACCPCGSMSLTCPGRPSPSKPAGSSPSSSGSRRQRGRRQSRRQSNQDPVGNVCGLHWTS